MAVVLVLVAMAAAAVHQMVIRSQALETAAGRAAAFDATASRAEVALAELAASERGYVAPGQGLDFWAGKVDEALASARTTMTELQSAATSAEAARAAESAASRLDDFAVMDQRVRDYAREDQRSMASDLIFADGYELIATARAELASAVSLERAALGAPVTRDRQVQLASLGMLALCTLVAALLLLRGPGQETPVVTPLAPETFAPAPAARNVPVADDAIGAALDASLEGLDDVESAAGLPALPASPASAVDLSAAADVCVDLARLLDARDLQAVLARVASVLAAEGLIVWMADETGHSLAPALTHGYAPALVARLGNLSVEDHNATADAWRSKSAQVVDGALAVPLLTSGGCTGVLAVEVKNGNERDGDVQALARIIAAQLAASVSPSAPEARRAAEA